MSMSPTPIGLSARVRISLTSHRKSQKSQKGTKKDEKRRLHLHLKLKSELTNWSEIRK